VVTFFLTLATPRILLVLDSHSFPGFDWPRSVPGVVSVASWPSGNSLVGVRAIPSCLTGDLLSLGGTLFCRARLAALASLLMPNPPGLLTMAHASAHTTTSTTMLVAWPSFCRFTLVWLAAEAAWE